MYKELIILIALVILTVFITKGFWNKSHQQKEMKLDWITVTTTSEIEELISGTIPVLFFKHSFQCGISAHALRRFESEWSIKQEECKIVFVDVHVNRAVSNYISQSTDLTHHSPQAILLYDQEVIYHASHGAINAQKIETIIKTKALK